MELAGSSQKRIVRDLRTGVVSPWLFVSHDSRESSYDGRQSNLVDSTKVHLYIIYYIYVYLSERARDQMQEIMLRCHIARE